MKKCLDPVFDDNGIDHRNRRRVQLDHIIQSFFQACESMGCLEKCDSTYISSGVDESVRFIGSHISILLPYMLKQSIPHRGITMWQDCLRTQNLAKIQQNNSSHKWGSSFLSVGGVFPIKSQNMPFEIAKRLLNSLIHNGSHEIEIQYFNDDYNTFFESNDKQGFLKKSYFEAEPFRHKVGVDYLEGKNVNLALTSGNRSIPVGNIIKYRNSITGKDCGVELALGVNVILYALLKLNHVLDTFPVTNVGTNIPAHDRYLLEDCLTTSVYLLRENLKPSARNAKTRILKEYVETFRRVTKQYSIDKNEIIDMINNYYSLYYNSEFITCRDLKLPPNIILFKCLYQ